MLRPPTVWERRRRSLLNTGLGTVRLLGLFPLLIVGDGSGAGDNVRRLSHDSGGQQGAGRSDHPHGHGSDVFTEERHEAPGLEGGRGELDGRLANVFVSLGVSFPRTPVPTEPMTIDQRRCVYRPRVVGHTCSPEPARPQKRCCCTTSMDSRRTATASTPASRLRE